MHHVLIGHCRLTLRSSCTLRCQRICGGIIVHLNHTATGGNHTHGISAPIINISGLICQIIFLHHGDGNIGECIFF